MVNLFYGSQSTTIKNRIKKLVKEILTEVDDMNFVKFDMDEHSLFEIIDECAYLPLGYDKKVVYLSNSSFIGLDNKKISNYEGYNEFIQYLKNENPDVDLIVSYIDDEINENSEFFNYVKDNGKIFKVGTPSDAEWKEYVYRYLTEKLKVDIDKDAQYLLAERTKGNIDLFQNSASKLSLYSNHITIKDVATMVEAPLEDNVYQIFNHLVEGKNERAIKLYKDLKIKNIEEITLISTLATQFRQFNEVMYLSKNGYSYQAIAKELKINESNEELISKTLNDLHDLDYKIKSGQVDRDLSFELFLINYNK